MSGPTDGDLTMSLDFSTLDLTTGAAYTEADWREAVDKVLKGGSFERLRTRTADGLTIEPLYAGASDVAPIPTRHGATPWIVSTRIDHPDGHDANGLALADLTGGASGLDLVFASSPHARGYGLPVDALSAALDGVMLDLVTLRIDAGAETIAMAKALIELAKSQGISGDKLSLSLVADPIGLAARQGGSDGPLSVHVTHAAIQANALIENGFAGVALQPDGRIWHEAGASRVEALAAMLATAVAYWRALEAIGLTAETAAERIGFTLAVDQNQFSSLAEIRALRLLWQQATGAAGLAIGPAPIHAETSFRMMSQLDANTNMIRTTIAAFAAGVGGADSVCVLPYSAANGLPDAFARRLARNTQLILLEESNLYRVYDPAAGSGRVETETRQLAEAAWSLFREIEACGGIIASLESGYLQGRIAGTAEARMKNIARRKEPLTGVSEYPILTSAPVTVLDIPAGEPHSPSITNPLPPLDNSRLSEPFERLRTTAVSAALNVFLAPLGTIADFNVRATWVKNLFEVGGITVLANDGFGSLTDLVDAFRSSGTKAVCLASSDAIYATDALPALAALKAAGAGPIFLAGKPNEIIQEDSFRAAGVDVFLFAGQDVIATLTDAQSRIRNAV